MFSSVILHLCINCRVLWHMISLIPSERNILGIDIITGSSFPGLMLFPNVVTQTTKSVVSDKHTYQLQRSQVANNDRSKRPRPTFFHPTFPSTHEILYYIVTENNHCYMFYQFPEALTTQVRSQVSRSGMSTLATTF